MPRKTRGIFFGQNRRTMKDYVRILKTTRRASLEHIITLKPGEGELNEWKVLKLIEETASQMRSRLKGITEPEISEQITKIKLDLLGTAEKGARVFLKAQFFPSGKNEILLKVFAHQVNGKGKASRLARASYYLVLEKSYTTVV